MRDTARLLTMAALAACADSAPPPPAKDLGSFALLQSEVLAKSCAVGGCHIGAGVAASGNLSLANDVAWANLVNALPTQFAYDFPPGVALRMPANAALDLNLHYANRSGTSLTGEAFANIYTADPATVQYVAKPLNMANLNIALPPNARTTLQKTFLVNQVTTVFALTSHMHMLGEKFQIKIVGGARDGELVYENTDWEHPQLLLLNTPIVLQPGEGLKSVITWNNTMGHTVQFGLLSTDEMGIIFGYYY